MKFKEDRPLPSLEASERKLLELANAVEVDHAGRLDVGAINKLFRDAGGAMRNSARRLKPLSRTAGLRCIRPEVIYHSRKPGRTCSLRSGHCSLTAARVRGTFHTPRVGNVTARSFDETCRYAAHCSSGAVGIC